MQSLTSNGKKLNRTQKKNLKLVKKGKSPRAVSRPLSTVPRKVDAPQVLSSRQGRRKAARGAGKSTTLTPARRRVWLEYVSLLKPTSGATTTLCRAYMIESNAAFAVDPAAPTGWTTTPGFSVLATNYASYRVLRYKGTISFENISGTGNGSSVVCHSNSALGVAAGGSNSVDLAQFAANRPTFNTIKPIAAGSLGGAAIKVVHSFDHTIPSITGESINQPGYKSATNTIPSILTYIVFGVVVQVTQTNLQYDCQVKLKMLVEFSDYIDTLTSFETSQPTPQSERDRLLSLGEPPKFQPCAGCKYVTSLEQGPCPDPDCKIVDMCSNCGCKRRCSLFCQSSRCPWRADTIKLLLPELSRKNSSKVLESRRSFANESSELWDSDKKSLSKEDFYEKS